MSEANGVPALQLPFELISLIFILCLPVRRRVCPHPDKPPLNLASVCGHWRGVALRTPELWSSIALQFSPNDSLHGVMPLSLARAVHRDGNDFVALMDLWFSRALEHPLSISLACARHGILPNGLLALVAFYHAQWARIEVALRTHDFLFFNSIAGPFPLLSTLTIKITDRFTSLHRAQILPILRSPNLKTVQLFYHRFTPESLALLPRNLTAARFVYLSGVDATQSTAGLLAPLLRHLNHIVHLHLDVANSVGTPDRRLEASLLTLRLNVDHVLDVLSIPTLQSLHVKLMLPARICDFLAHSQCHLTTLSIEVSDYVNEISLGTALSAAPELRTLIVAVGPIFPYTALHHCELLFDINLVPQLRNLIVEERKELSTYDRWTELLELRAGAAFVYGELYLRPAPSRDEHDQLHFVPPSQGIQARWAVLAAGGTQPRILAGNYTWPADVKDADPIGDLDNGFTEQRDLQPYYFSPF
ncbi:F-box domain-containing protein [Favolaschia claudopus]|uniref:F-box domain-containing protein n=1 Tax=Favolaschia claudopus TaxID=2862362 RepID=A0AAW0CDP1_9AGAR